MAEKKLKPIKRVVERDENPFEGAFAPNLPIELAPVRITPPATTPGRTTITAPTQPNLPSKSPSIGARTASGIGSLASRLFLFLTPMNSGPDGTGDLYPGPYIPAPQPDEVPPEPVPELEPVIITPPPPPGTVGAPTTAPELPFERPSGNPKEPFMPGRGPDPGDDGDLGNRPAPQSPGSPGELLNPAGPDVFPDDDGALEPVIITSPQPGPSAPVVFPDAYGIPDTFEFGSPRPGPSPARRPRAVPLPGGGTAPRDRPTAYPLIPDFLVADPLRPGRPGPTRPDFLTDPTPDLTRDPLEDPGFNLDPAKPGDDACQCDKPPKKKKPKGKREVCKQGTYTQRAKGIKYSPKRTVPCEEGAIEATRKSKSRTSRPKPSQFPSISLF